MGMAPPTQRVGDIEIWSVLDGRLTVGAPNGFPPEDSPEFQVHADYIQRGKWLIDIGGFLVRSGDRLVLIDAGSGPGNGETYTPAPFTSLDDADPALVAWARGMGVSDRSQIEPLLQSLMQTDIRTGSFGANLAALGFRPEDVTDVLISHLHFDHIGWVSKDGRPYFPNAVVRCEHHDAEYFLAPDHDDSFYRAMWNAVPTKERMAPVLDRFETWHEDAVIAPGIECRFAPGHTPGSSIFTITSGDEQALILGDAVHCAQELIDPEFEPNSDMDVEEANRSREMIRHAAAREGVHVSAPHFPALRFGRLRIGNRPHHWQFEWSRSSSASTA
jgi:glyoxylase-like metal-dependent hydrolase (beta-lactamase superfamily II)